MKYSLKFKCRGVKISEIMATMININAREKAGDNFFNLNLSWYNPTKQVKDTEKSSKVGPCIPNSGSLTS